MFVRPLHCSFRRLSGVLSNRIEQDRFALRLGGFGPLPSQPPPSYLTCTEQRKEITTSIRNDHPAPKSAPPVSCYHSCSYSYDRKSLPANN